MKVLGERETRIFKTEDVKQWSKFLLPYKFALD